MSKKVVILGAGLAGLSTAFHLQGQARVFEKEQEVGGLARSDNVDGFIFDHDGHLLHFKNEYARKLVNRLLPQALNLYNRNAWVYSHNVYTKYPFQANTFGLPLYIVKRCIMGMLGVKTKNKAQAHDHQNLYDWMISSFGKGITKYFMYPYNHKFWTIPPEQLIADWTYNYVPQVKVKAVLDGALTLKTKPLGYNSQFYYPKKGGIGQLPKAIAANVKPIKTGYQAEAIDIRHKKVSFQNNKTEDFTHLVSSIPLVELRDIIIDKLPEKVNNAFSKLKYISLYNLNLGIERQGISDKHWIYYPEDKFLFFRVGFPMNFSANVTPANKSSLYAEVSYSKYKPLPKKDIDKTIENDLINAGILNSQDRILVRHVNDIKYAYVVYDQYYPDSVKTINEFLLENNIFPVGRFGRWKYMSMEDVIMDGKQVSDIIERS
jgi:protoporphyrinogen oxidase